MIATRWFVLSAALLALPTTAAPTPPEVAPAAAPAAAGFAEGATATTLPFRLLNNHIYVQAVVEGRPLTLLFDTGGVDMLSTQAAKALGLTVKAAAAEAVVDVGLARAKRVELGAYGLNDVEFYVADLGRLPEVEGLAFDGMIGFESVKDLAVTIDYGARRITLTAPAAFVAPAGAAKLPFALAERLPVVDGEVDGMKGRFTIDTGARGSVALSAPFVAAHSLLERYPRRHEATTGWGISGASRAYATRAGWLKLGALEVKAPVLELSSAALGNAGDRYISGNVGGGILKRFTVTFDYAGSALYLAPNAELAAFDPFDRSGMWINLDGEDLIVDDLMSNGPAARAQVQEHDRIVSVDGVPATQLSLLDLRAKLRDLPKGYRVRMTLRRDSKVVYATIVLDDLVPPP
jgi:predicted aspartyl protease